MRRCLQLVAQDFKAAWNERDRFADYQGDPSTSFKMNSLDYAARQIGYLCDIEEIIVVR